MASLYQLLHCIMLSDNERSPEQTPTLIGSMFGVEAANHLGDLEIEVCPEGISQYIIYVGSS